MLIVSSNSYRCCTSLLHCYRYTLNEVCMKLGFPNAIFQPLSPLIVCGPEMAKPTSMNVSTATETNFCEEVRQRTWISPLFYLSSNCSLPLRTCGIPQPSYHSTISDAIWRFSSEWKPDGSTTLKLTLYLLIFLPIFAPKRLQA